MRYWSVFVLIVVLVFVPAVFGGQEGLELVGWGIERDRDMGEFFARADKVGFDAIIAWSANAEFLTKTVKAADKHGIKVFGTIRPTNERQLGTLGQMGYSGEAPWQVISEAQQCAARFISAGNNASVVPYQWGGEPVMTDEVLVHKILCLNNKQFRDKFKGYIDQILSVEGIEGIAFDGVGYQNYRCCYCKHCRELLAEYRESHKKLSEAEAEVSFFRESLVDYINSLADYARSKRPGIKTTLHIWPVFASEPLYGNRLDVDYCGQTAAWFTLWPEEKIAEYSRVISEQANKFYPRKEGVAMIGYYDRPGSFGYKDAQRVDMELRTILANGCRRVQVCETKDVLDNEEVAGIFSKYFKNNKQEE